MPKFIPIPYIKIGGQDVSQELETAILEIIVDTSLYLPSMFTIKLMDPALKWVDDALLDIGKEVQIQMKADENEGATQASILIKGEITALEPSFSPGGETALVIRGYDKAHRLHRGKKTRAFLNTKDSDLASKVAG